MRRQRQATADNNTWEGDCNIRVVDIRTAYMNRSEKHAERGQCCWSSVGPWLAHGKQTPVTLFSIQYRWKKHWENFLSKIHFLMHFIYFRLLQSTHVFVFENFTVFWPTDWTCDALSTHLEIHKWLEMKMKTLWKLSKFYFSVRLGRSLLYWHIKC